MGKNTITRGFVTLATGDLKYYKMAQYMLKSLKLHNPEAKCAIICDKKNEIAEQFDDVVVLAGSQGNYCDKFLLLLDSPYEESIFIEPDCIVYKNLEFFWEIFEKGTDFSCFGWNDGGIDCWFRTEETKRRLLQIVPQLKDTLQAPLFNPGYFYIRKGEKCNKMYDDCLRISNQISNDEILNKYDPIYCRGKLRDDPIFNIAMVLNEFVCSAKPSVGNCIFLPSRYKINRIDIKNSVLDVTDKDGRQFNDCSLLHFSTRRANEEGLYLWQCLLIDLLENNPNSFLYSLLNNKLVAGVFNLYRYIKTRIMRLYRK